MATSEDVRAALDDLRNQFATISDANARIIKAARTSAVDQGNIAWQEAQGALLVVGRGAMFDEACVELGTIANRLGVADAVLWAAYDAALAIAVADTISGATLAKLYTAWGCAFPLRRGLRPDR